MFGKLLGAMIGAGVGLAFHSGIAALVLAIVGAFVGHRVDALHAAPEELNDAMLDFQLSDDPPAPAKPPPRIAGALPEPEPTTAAFSAAACALFGELAKVDGEVTREEVRVAREYFETHLRYGTRQLQHIRNQLKAALAQSRELDRPLEVCREELDAKARLRLLDALYELALADGELRRSERDLLKRLARGLEIPESDHRALSEKHFGDGAEQYAALGVSPDVSDEELKAAFRRLAAAHHPDRFAHQGKAAADRAAEKFRALQDAYDELRRIRSF